MVQSEVLAQPVDDTVDVIDVRASRKALVAGTIGNLIEWYEFAVYAYMAPYIAVLFFPSDVPGVAILSTFMVFALAFFMRPIGAIIFGRLTDRFGRRPILATIIIIMSVATALIGLLPTAVQIGVLAPILLVLCRIAQGLSGGGEMGGAVSLLVENAPSNRRGLYGSWSFAGTTLGFVLGGTVATILAATLSADAMGAWGWRIPFLLAIPMGLIALYIRLRIDETPHFKRIQREREEVGSDRKLPPATIKLGAVYLLITIGVLVVYNAIGNTFMVGMPTYLTTAFGLPPTSAYFLTLITGVVGGLTMPLFGLLSDRIGRWPVLAFGTICTLVLSYPLYLLMGTGFGGGLVALFVAGLLIGIVGGPMPAFLSERFPTRNRGTGVAVIYAISVAVFGGSAPYVITWIFTMTGNPYAAAIYTIFCAVISTIALLAWRFSRQERIDAHNQPLTD